MNETIYLTCTKDKVEKMTKSLPNHIRKHEVPIKLHINIPDEAFSPPTVEHYVHIEDWRKGIDLEDVQFKKYIITDEEAEIIRARRLEKMTSVLREQGYTVEAPIEEEDED